MTPRAKKVVAIAAAVSGLLGIGALAHVRSVQALFGATGCPFDPSARPPSAEKLEDFRVKSLASLRSGEHAPARPALHFALGRTTRTEVARWAEEVRLACHDELGSAALRCEPTNGEPLAGRHVEDVFFRFDPRGRLVATDLVHARTTPARAAEIVQALAASVERAAGAPSAVQGTPSESHLAGGRLSRVAFEFRFADYAADVSATSFAPPEAAEKEAPSRGDEVVTVREQYRLLVEVANR